MSLNKFQQWVIENKPSSTLSDKKPEIEIKPTPIEELQEAWEDWKYEFRYVIKIINFIAWGFIIATLTLTFAYLGNIAWTVLIFLQPSLGMIVVIY